MTTDSLIGRLQGVSQRVKGHGATQFIRLEEAIAIIRKHEALQSQRQNLTINEPSLSNEVREILATGTNQMDECRAAFESRSLPKLNLKRINADEYYYEVTHMAFCDFIDGWRAAIASPTQVKAVSLEDISQDICFGSENRITLYETIEIVKAVLDSLKAQGVEIEYD